MVELQLSADDTDMMSDTDSPDDDEDDGLLPDGTSFGWNLVREAIHRASNCVKSVNAALVTLALSSTTSRTGEESDARWSRGGNILSSLL